LVDEGHGRWGFRYLLDLEGRYAGWFVGEGGFTGGSGTIVNGDVDFQNAKV